MDPDFAKTYRMSILIGQLSGVGFMIAGVGLFAAGVGGVFDIAGESETIKATITNASPGVLLVVCGTVILWRYKPNMSQSDTAHHQGNLAHNAEKEGLENRDLATDAATPEAPETTPTSPRASGGGGGGGGGGWSEDKDDKREDGLFSKKEFWVHRSAPKPKIR